MNEINNENKKKNRIKKFFSFIKRHGWATLAFIVFIGFSIVQVYLPVFIKEWYLAWSMASLTSIFVILLEGLEPKERVGIRRIFASWIVVYLFLFFPEMNIFDIPILSESGINRLAGIILLGIIVGLFCEFIYYAFRQKGRRKISDHMGVKPIDKIETRFLFKEAIYKLSKKKTDILVVRGEEAEKDLIGSINRKSEIIEANELFSFADIPSRRAEIDLGIITKSDVCEIIDFYLEYKKKFAEDFNLFEQMLSDLIKIEGFLTKLEDVISIDKNYTVEDTAQKMFKEERKYIPIIEDNQISKVIKAFDIL